MAQGCLLSLEFSVCRRKSGVTLQSRNAGILGFVPTLLLRNCVNLGEEFPYDSFHSLICSVNIFY